MRESFPAIRQSIYDTIRRRYFRPNEFDGPDATIVNFEKSIEPESFLSSQILDVGSKNRELDAFFEACSDLAAEGLLKIFGGRMELCDRPLPSDRSVDAVSDHGAQSVREIGLDASIPDELDFPRLLPLPSLPGALMSFVRKEDFGEVAIVYNRLIVVENERRAITFSAMKPFVETRELTEKHFSELKKSGVFATLTKYGYEPTMRKERLMVRFPYNDERSYLSLHGDLTRVPVIVAFGRVYAGDVLVEKYVNIMRADRYVIDSQIPLRPSRDGVALK